MGPSGTPDCRDSVEGYAVSALSQLIPDVFDPEGPYGVLILSKVVPEE
jgi:hypothetical protein